MVFEVNPIAHRGDRLTDDEFYDFGQANPCLRMEREGDSQIVFMLHANTKPGLKNADLISGVADWNHRTKSDVVADSGAGFTLSDTSVRTPDVSWISHERWNILSEQKQDESTQICPDFAVGLVSDSDEKYTLPAKMEKYRQNGVRPGWAINPFQNQTIIYRPDREAEAVALTTQLSGETVLPGFILLPSDLRQ